MQIQNITNSQLNPQNFQGRIDVLPGNLSYVPAKNLRKAYNTLSEMIKNKPYNLYVRQIYKYNDISIVIQTENNFIRNKGPKVEYVFSANDDRFESATKSVIKSYEEIQSTPLSKKIKNGLKKIGHKLLKVLVIEE